MTILEQTPLTLAEVVDLSGDSDKEKEVKSFIKKFNKMKVGDAKKMREELTGLNILKLKEQHIVKIVDFMPEDSADLNKLIDDVSLDQDETSKVLDVVKKY